jgi:glutathione peroxidase
VVRDEAHRRRVALDEGARRDHLADVEARAVLAAQSRRNAVLVIPPSARARPARRARSPDRRRRRPVRGGRRGGHPVHSPRLARRRRPGGPIDNMAETTTRTSATSPTPTPTGAERTLAEFGERRPHRERRVEVRAHRSTSSSRSCSDLRRARAAGDRVPLQPVHGSGAGLDGRDPRVLLGDLGRHFPIMDKVRVNGSHAAPLQGAQEGEERRGREGAVMWNFEKFLVSRPATCTASARRRSPTPRGHRRDRGIAPA